jgi:hypothetical protein
MYLGIICAMECDQDISRAKITPRWTKRASASAFIPRAICIVVLWIWEPTTAAETKKKSTANAISDWCTGGIPWESFESRASPDTSPARPPNWRGGLDGTYPPVGGIQCSGPRLEYSISWVEHECCLLLYSDLSHSIELFNFNRKKRNDDKI